MTDYDRRALASLAAYLTENTRKQMTLPQIVRCFGWTDEAHALRAMRQALVLYEGREPIPDIVTRDPSISVIRSSNVCSFLHTPLCIPEKKKEAQP